MNHLLNSSPMGMYVHTLINAVSNICFGLFCIAVVYLILFLFTTFAKQACYNRPLRDYYIMLEIVLSSTFDLFVKFWKTFFYSVLLANLVLIVGIVLFVFTHFFLAKTGFVVSSFKLTNIDLEINSENKTYSISFLIWLTLLFDSALFSIILHFMSVIIMPIFSYIFSLVNYLLTTYTFIYNHKFFLTTIDNLREHLLYTSIKPFHMLSLFTVDSINFFFCFVKDIAQDFCGFSLPLIKIPVLFFHFFKSFGFEPDDIYSRNEWLVIILDICATIIFSYMIIFSENKLVLKIKGKAYTCVVIILFLFILLPFSVHLVEFTSFLSHCILPDEISNFSDFVNYFSQYAEDKKAKYRKAANVTFYELTLKDLGQEIEVSYELVDSATLYALVLALISILLMFLFIYLGIPYSCSEKFDADDSLHKVSPLHLFPYGYGVFWEYFKKRASLNIFYILFVTVLFFLLVNVYSGFYAKHVFIFYMGRTVFLYAYYCYCVLHVLTFFALEPFLLYSSGLDALLSCIALIFIIYPSFLFTIFLLFYLELIPTTGLFSPFYNGDWFNKIL